MAPSRSRLKNSMRDVFARQQKPDCTANPFRFASSALARTERTPAASVAMGFSRNACLPAATAAWKCCGRKPGGVVSSTTSTPEAITFLQASSPTNRRSAGTWIRDGSLTDFATSRRPTSIFAGSMSPIAYSTVLLSAASASAAAPLPRPPQPIRPTLSVSLLAANDFSGKLRFAANTDPSAAVVDALKNCRREVEAAEVVWSRMIPFGC